MRKSALIKSSVGVGALRSKLFAKFSFKTIEYCAIIKKLQHSAVQTRIGFGGLVSTHSLLDDFGEKIIMKLSVGEKISYPSQGICLVENIVEKKIGDILMQFYALRVLSDNSTIFVPVANAETVGIRPIICLKEYKSLINRLGADFENVSDDWKSRSKEYGEKLQSGDVFAAVDVLKKLTFLSHEKKLSFREQTLMEKARFLIVSEIINAGLAPENKIENKITKLVGSACHKHFDTQPSVVH